MSERSDTGDHCADMELFWTELTRGVCSGSTLLETLRAIYSKLDGRRSPRAAVVASLCRGVEGGRTLSEAMQGYPDLFGRHVVCLMEGGERAGIVDRVLPLILEYAWRCPDCILARPKSAH
jgi:type II secretory pathway component PulF